MHINVPHQLFDFAMKGSVPRTDAQIARAKRQAVGGKRKRCTKGKNCSAACIAANMICLVDLPWVGSALTQSVKLIQAKQGKAPAAKPAAAKPIPAPAAAKPASTAPKAPSQTAPKSAAPAPTPTAVATPAPQPAPAPSPKPVPKSASAKTAPTPAASAPTPKVDMAKFKDAIKTQSDKTLNSLLKNHSDKLTPAQRKAIQDELKVRSKQPIPTAQKPPSPSPQGTPKPLAPPAAPVPILPTVSATSSPPKSTRDNPWALTPQQKDTWKDALGKFDEKSWNKYANISRDYVKLSDPKEVKQQKLLETVNQKLSQPLRDAWDTDTVSPSAPSYLKKAEKALGNSTLIKGLTDIRDFSEDTYSLVRSAQRNRVPMDDDWRDDKWKQDTIKKYKKVADDIEATLSYLPKPQVPKFRGVAVEDDRLDTLKQLVKDRGVMIERSMNSWSTRNSVAQQFADDGVDMDFGTNRVIYRTMNKNGVPIKELSAHSEEDELLTKSNSSYRFFDYHEVDVGGNKLHVFDVMEF